MLLFIYKQRRLLFIDYERRYPTINNEEVVNLKNLSTNIFGINGLRKYGINEMNLLLLISFKCKSTQESVINLTFSEFEHYTKIINFSQFDSTFLEKFIKTTWTEEKNTAVCCHLLFSKVEINLEQQIISFYVNPEILDSIINISEYFTSDDLESFITLTSSYTKVAYILTKKMEGMENYTISMKEFKSLLEVPIKYKMSDIDKKVFSPILEQLDKHYPRLKIEKINGNKGNSVAELKFHFIAEAA